MDNASAKELFILGRVSVRPTHGHEIMRTLRASQSDMWVELSEKHVYYVLRKLEREGLISSSEERIGNLPPRKVFTITDEGKATLAEMMQAEGIIRSNPYSDFDVAFGMLAYTDVLDDVTKMEVLHRRRDFLNELIEKARAARAEAVERPEAGGVQSAIMDKVCRMAAAELEWLEEVMVRIDADGWASMKPLIGSPQGGESS